MWWFNQPADFPNIQSVKVLRDRSTGRSKGAAFMVSHATVVASSRPHTAHIPWAGRLTCCSLVLLHPLAVKPLILRCTRTTHKQAQPPVSHES